MVISYVLRLRPDALADGRFVGEVEAVMDRRTARVRTIDQVVSFILATGPSQMEASLAAGSSATGEEVAADNGDDDGGDGVR